MNKDIVAAVAALAVVAGISYGLAWTRPDLPLRPSQPFGGEKRETPAAKKKDTGGNVVMRVNGEPVTEREFVAFLQSIPEQQRPFFANPAGRRQLADEIVRVKLLEQEAARLGVAEDPEVKKQLETMRTRLTDQMELMSSQLMAGRALEKLTKDRVDQAVRAEFEKEKNGAVTLRHILIAYKGSPMSPDGTRATPLTADEAMKKAEGLVARLRGGAPFAEIAKTESDDRQSAQVGGVLGAAKREMLPGMLPPEVAEVVGGLAPGQVSDPVKTQYGIHIFSLSAPTLEELRPSLVQQAQQRIVGETLEKMQKGAKVQLDPKFFPDDTQPPRPRVNG